MSTLRETIRCERPATGGGVGHRANGQIVFIRHALPGELVDVEITDENAKISRGDAIAIVEASPERQAPPCNYAHPGGCGGCDLQHATPRAQSTWKSTLVSEQLRRLAFTDVDVPLESFGSGEGTRTRLRLAVNGEGQLGLRSHRSHEVVPIESCWLSDQRFGDALETPWTGCSEVELRAIGDGDPFAVVRRETDRGTLYELCDLWGRRIDPSTQSRVAVHGHHYSVSPRSFWQSHRDAPSRLVELVTAGLGAAPGDRVVDMFSGVGLFSVPLARLVGPGGSVVAVESSPFAVRDARRNLEGQRQVKVREWSVTPRSVNDAVQLDDLVVLDPPRTGLAKGVAEALVRRSPRRIVYVSCDAATFARDLALLQAGSYVLGDIQALDLFPMTEHLEIVAVLDRWSPAGQ